MRRDGFPGVRADWGATQGGCIDSEEPVYRFRRDVTRPGGPSSLLDVPGVNLLAQAAGIASWWIRKGIADRVEVLHRQRLVLAISRFDVQVLDDPGGPNTYQVRTVDHQHALMGLDHSAQLRDALIVADEQLLSRSTSAAVEIRRGRTTVALVTRADRGRVFVKPSPGRRVRKRVGDADAGPAAPP
ncbi:hypothetical protein [Streptomyces sanglieri]|uniref:hypothetical protein n=1 Tax=Streptomyces sanglieri TaxID=193460 RepID=UPI00352350AB